MKISISRTELVSLIGKIQNVVSSKPSAPILANVLLEASDDQLIISATDLTVSMRVIAKARVYESGGIALPAKRFFCLVRELTTANIEIHCTSPDIAFINSGSSKFKIKGVLKDEFPTLPDTSNAVQFPLKNSTLKEMFSKTSFAAARDDANQVLNGVLFQSLASEGIFISTDGKRLAKLKTIINPSDEHFGSYIIPLKAVEEICRVLDSDLEGQCKVFLMEDKIAIDTHDTKLTSKLISGKYPEVSRVIPEKKPNAISLHREELMSLLRQVSLFTSDACESVKFTFTTNELQITAVNSIIGEGKVSMPVNYLGPQLDIAFNPHYFLDILKHSSDEAINLNVSDPYNPGLVYDSSDALFVIMPMRLERVSG